MPKLSGAHVLVVDDQALIRTVLRHFLEKGGCKRVDEAANGVEALALLTERHPDIIICDINMAPGDGFSFVRELRAGPGSGIPVIFLTCNADEAFVNEAKNLDASGYLLKPVPPRTTNRSCRPGHCNHPQRLMALRPEPGIHDLLK